MFLGIYDIDEYVAIPAATHRFSSGAAYAPSALTYSIYEDGGATGLDENVDMTPASPFDAITGAYLARRQLTAAAGFERDKTYLIAVKATVDSVAAVELHVFQIRQKQTGDSYARLGAPAGASVSADVAAVKAETATIVADTNELQTDLVNGGRLDLLIDAILEDTGTTLDTKINTIDGIVDDILEDTVVIGVAGAGLTALPWNAAWDAEVQSECTDALNAYDPPTNAEMVARTIAAADYATASALTTVAGYLDTEIAAILEDTGTTIPATLATLAGYIDTEVAAVLAAVDTEIAAILADTNELQTDLVNGGRLDLLIDAIKTKTDNLPTDPADQSAVEAAITAATSPLATAAALDAVDNYVDTEVAAIKAVTDKLDTAVELDGAVYRLTTNALEQAPTGGGTAPTVQEIVDGVLDELLSAHADVGSVGAGIAAAGSAGDPWSTPLPGSYGEGTAGHIIGHPNVLLPVMQGQIYTATAMQGREVVVVQGDTPRITFDLDDDYTGWTVYFAAKGALADTGYAIDPKAGTWSDVDDGQGYVDLTALETANTGKYYAELELRNGTQRLTAMKFTLKVIDSVIKE